MKIGYACINTQIDCTSNSTFRLSSYSEEKLKETIKKNIDCLRKILQFNLEHNILFFRIGSEFIPFASHKINKFDWVKYFKKEFVEIGNFAKKNNMRLTMHPGQYTVLNSPRDDVVNNAIKDLEYHCKVLDAMNLDDTCKIKIHIGGIYGDKKAAIKRFIFNYKKLPSFVKKRLVIENDDKSYSLKDCLEISSKINIPVVFDFFHHECLNNGESNVEGLKLAMKTWQKKDGKIITHYSNQKKNGRKGSHSETIDLKEFEKFLKEIKDFDVDIMLEVKDKEQSVLNYKNIRKN
jgi:UV DNA damage endonuclease